MKIKSLSILLFINISTFSQTTEMIVSKINENGLLTGVSIVSLANKTSSDIFNSSIEWISYTYRNSENVVQSKVENKMIRLNGISPSIIGPFMGFYFDLEYIIQLDIKDGKLRFNAYDIKQVAKTPPYTKSSLELMFEKTGELRSAKRYIKVKGQIDSELTRLLISLKDKIEGKSVTEADEW